MSRLWIVAILGALLGGLAALLILPAAQAPPPPVATGKALIGGPFTLVDHTGKTVTEKDFLGQYTLVYFGFTNCPDICPAALQTITAALDALGPKAARITPLFITVDPERDTPARLAEYVASFHPRLVGLTGAVAQVKAAAKAYRVYFEKAATGQEPSDYSVDHSSMTYLMDPRGVYVAHFPHGAGAAEMTRRLAELP